MNTDTPTPADWQDALMGPITFLLDVATIIGVLGIILGLILLIRSSPKAPTTRPRIRP